MKHKILLAFAALPLAACITPDKPPENEPAEALTVPPEEDADQMGVDDTAIDEDELNEDEPDAVLLDETTDG